MHQLQEQLQINLLQQTHMMQAVSANNSSGDGDKAGKPSSATAAALQQLQMQQQQLISQLQLVQQRIVMVRGNLSYKKLSWEDIREKRELLACLRGKGDVRLRGYCKSLRREEEKAKVCTQDQLPSESIFSLLFSLSPSLPTFLNSTGPN